MIDTTKLTGTYGLSAAEVREAITGRLAKINRKGVDNLLAYINDDRNGYFAVSCCRHHRFRGGMACHALGVYLGMRQMNRRYWAITDDDSLALIAFAHDICDSYGCRFHGHGRASVALLDSLGVELTAGERYAILHHMYRHHESQWRKAFGLGSYAAPDSKHRLLLFMLQDSADARRYHRQQTHNQYNAKQK